MDGTLTTNDGVTLSYRTYGAGSPVVFLHGWLLSSRLWEPVVEQLAGCLRVVYDHRGHGASADPRAGWHVHRLAFDLHELLDHLDLLPVTLVGHSMGCSVIWAYLEMFGPARVRKLVFIDQPPVVVHDPGSDGSARARAGSVFTEEQVATIAHGLADPATREKVVRELVSGMVNRGFPDEQMRDLLAVRVDGAFSAALFADFAHQDWRREISRITRPTLVVAGRASMVPWTGGRWIAEQVPGARLEVVEGADDGSHLLILEAGERVAHVLSTFLAQ